MMRIQLKWLINLILILILSSCLQTPFQETKGDLFTDDNKDVAQTSGGSVPSTSDSCGDISSVLSSPTNRCLNCHNTSPGILGGGLDLMSPNPGARMVGVSSNSSSCSHELLIDPDNIDNSLLLKLVDKDLYDDWPNPCMQIMPFGSGGQGVHSSDVACIRKWTEQLISEHTPSSQVTNTENIIVSPFGALNKVKMILHGGAVTSDEYTSVIKVDGIDKLELKNRIGQWFDSEEGRKKLTYFLGLTLQQTGWDVRDPENGIRLTIGKNLPIHSRFYPETDKWFANVQESFIRTALDIIDNNRPFHEIVTTRRHAVTTALLSTLSWMENTQSQGSFGSSNTRFTSRFKNRDLFVDNDFDDWRFVNLTQSSTRGAISYSDLPAIRAITGEGSFPLALPRVGFFNTPSFQLRFPTNVGNQFRVTSNQALIVALGQTYSAGDSTVHGNISDLDADHAKPETTCFQCHRLMDPMAATFKSYYNTNYRTESMGGQLTPLSPSFTFRGVHQPITSMDSFANIIANHPLFASAWVGKLCQYANSKPCDSNSPEFARLSTFFKNSNYNLKELIKELFSSSLVLGDSGTEYASGFKISLNRKNHFCHAISTRLRDLKIAGGEQGYFFDRENICNQQIGSIYISKVSAAMLEDKMVRGGPALTQATEMSFLNFLTVEKTCGGIAEAYDKLRRSQASHAQNGSLGLDPTTEENLNDSLNNIVSIFMGIPVVHPRFQLTKNVLKSIYDHHVASSNKKYTALSTVIKFACSSPDLTGVGL